MTLLTSSSLQTHPKARRAMHIDADIQLYCVLWRRGSTLAFADRFILLRCRDETAKHHTHCQGIQTRVESETLASLLDLGWSL